MKQLIVAYNQNYPAYSFSTSTGMRGIFIDIVNELARRLDFSFCFETNKQLHGAPISSSFVPVIEHATNQFDTLVVDDQELNREVLKTMLRSLGLECREFADGQATLQELEVKKPDLIFLDLVMSNEMEKLQKLAKLL